MPPRLKAFPLGWVTTGRTVLLVGGCGGELCRLRHALAFDWKKILVCAPAHLPACCRDCLGDERVERRDGAVTEQTVQQADCVLECTADRKLAETLAGWCRNHRIPLNANDKPDLCDVHYPALFIRDPLVLAILSGGEAPALSATLRRWLEKHLGPGWSTAARLLSDLRKALPAGQDRVDVLKDIASDSKLLDYIEKNDSAGLQRLIDDALHRVRTGNLSR